MTVKRIYPKDSKGGIWVALGVGVLLVLVGVFYAISGGGNSISLLLAGGSFLFGAWLLFAGFKQIQAGNIFKRGTSTAKATVQKRMIRTREQARGEYATETVNVYELELKFSPSAGQEMTPLAEVSKELYDLHTEGKSIIVEYANENPLVFMIEGEK